jgi:hypothetical protein
MNTGSCESLFLQINEKSITLLDFIDYANQLLNNGKKDIFLKPEIFISVFTQAERMLCPDLLQIHVNPFYEAFLETESAFVQTLKGKRTPIALKNILAQAQPKSVICEIVTALRSLTKKPIVLTINSPQKWLHQVRKSVDENKQPGLTLDDFERASMYIAELLRTFSTLGFAAIILSETEETAFSSADLLTSYQPILNVANHYKWPLGIQINTGKNNSTFVNEKVDFYLSQAMEIEELAPLWQQGLAVGGGLNRDFWTGKLPKKMEAPKGFFFGTIPPEAEPETVLSQLNLLQS